MKKTAPLLIFVMILGSFSASCSRTDSNSQNVNQASDTAQTSENSNSTKDNSESLALIVNLPFEPEDAVWREEKGGNGKEGKLTAVLEFKPEDADKIVASAQNYQPPTPADIGAESWFPAELVAQSQLSGDETIKGTSFSAKDFFQTPYSDGKITRVQASNYFILELNSK